jgi:hypothetical protein
MDSYLELRLGPAIFSVLTANFSFPLLFCLNAHGLHRI